jgi:hypothetical protein
MWCYKPVTTVVGNSTVENIVRVSLAYLGYRAKDKVTEMEGVITSACFDVYGCVQLALTPPAKDGKLGDSAWFDLKRLEVDTTSERVMPSPRFFDMPVGEEVGGYEKSVPSG